MNTIWKFALPISDRVTVSMPAGAQILTVQVQQETPCLWAVVNPESQRHEARVFRVFGTGHPFDLAWPKGHSSSYLGSIQLQAGALIFHVFEER